MRKHLTETIFFDCYGVKIGIGFNRREAADSIRAVLPLNAEEIDAELFAAASVKHWFSLEFAEREEGDSVFRANDAAPQRFRGTHWVFNLLRTRLRHYVSQNSPDFLFVHAGVARWGDCLIMLPGAGFAGKTTLTAELVKAGAIYYSDEYAVVDRQGLVHPYPKPLSMRRRGDKSGEQTEVAVEEFGGIQGFAPRMVALAAILAFQPRARWQPVVLTPGNGVLELLKHSNNSLKYPELALNVLQKIASQAKIIKSKRGDAEKTAQILIKECDRIAKQ